MIELIVLAVVFAAAWVGSLYLYLNYRVEAAKQRLDRDQIEHKQALEVLQANQNTPEITKLRLEADKAKAQAETEAYRARYMRGYT